MQDDVDQWLRTFAVDERAGESLSDPRWSIYMKAELPEPADVVADIMRLCSSYVISVDRSGILAAVEASTWKKLHELTCERRDVKWQSLLVLRHCESFDHQRLAAFLSTHGAIGIAVNDKLSGHLTRFLPYQLAAMVESGAFDAD